MNRQLESLGLSIEGAHGAIVDATVIESAARPKRTVDVIAQDRDEPTDEDANEQAHCELHESADPDARWLKKGKKSYFGYKGFTSVDQQHGFVQHVHVKPANAYEGHELERISDELTEVEAFYADKAYCSQGNRERLKSKGKKSRIMHKAKRGSSMGLWHKRHNKLISKTRFRVEQCFGTLKRRFSFSRASYMGLEKVEGQLYMKAMCFNLLKAVNMMVAVG